MAGGRSEARGFDKERWMFSGSVPDVPRDLGCWTQAVEDLRRQFVQQIRDPSRTAQDIAALFVCHPASVGKLRAAVGVLLRSSALDAATQDDVISEARLIVLSNFQRHRDLGYDDSRGSWDSWLYVVWRNAVAESARSVRMRRKMEYLSPDQLDYEVQYNGHFREDTSMHDFRDALDVITKMPPGRMKEIMMDWAGGLSGADTARQRRISQPRVNQLRKKGLTFVREQLDLPPPVELA
jgi:DNA-directed RNA polymerase specialized sigma24 family protein